MTVIAVTVPPFKHVADMREVEELQRELRFALNTIQEQLDNQERDAKRYEREITNARAQRLMDQYGISSRWV